MASGRDTTTSPDPGHGTLRTHKSAMRTTQPSFNRRRRRRRHIIVVGPASPRCSSELSRSTLTTPKTATHSGSARLLLTVQAEICFDSHTNTHSEYDAPRHTHTTQVA